MAHKSQYDFSAEENNFALFTQTRNIELSFEPPTNEVRLALLDAAYKFKISSWQNMLSFIIDIFARPVKEETNVAPIALKGKFFATR